MTNGARSGLLLGLILAGVASATEPSLEPFKNHFVSGDYVATAVTLQHKGTKGFASGTFTIDPAQIPAGSEILAAYLYWQTISTPGRPDASAVRGARFKGNDISGLAVLLDSAGATPCWKPGDRDDDDRDHDRDDRPRAALWSFRADVLRFFPRVRPTDPGKSVDVQVTGQHTVTLPDAGPGKKLPSTLGAGLVIVYRVIGYDAASAYRAPSRSLRSVVIYDGSRTLGDPKAFRLSMEGFYEAARSRPNARLTFFAGNSRANGKERVFVSSTGSAADNQLVATNPFGNRKGFEAVSFSGIPLEPGAMKALITVDPGKGGCFDCLSFPAVILSLDVQDRDGDGLLDVWESRAEWASKPARLASVYPGWPLTDPAGAQLPDLGAMGANPDLQDLFVQIDYLRGSDGHSHLPARSALDAVAKAFHDAAPRPFLVGTGACAANAADGQCPINVHFDLGSAVQPGAGFDARACASAGTWTPDCALIPAALGKGGNPIDEVPCSSAGLTPSGARCAFPGFAGVVGWKSGFRSYRDAPIDRSAGSAECTAGQPGCEPRFPHARKDIFHYALFAHALGVPSPIDPTKPRPNSGVGDTGGGDLMVTLGLWDQQTGTPFVQGATLLHELGHNIGLHHGGVVSTSTLEPNCKTNYLSSMNWLYQTRGLLDAAGNPNLDFSRQALPTLSESGLTESTGLGAPTRYVPRWYAPAASSFLASSLGITPVTHFCDGSRVGAGDPRTLLIEGVPGSGAVDWNADGRILGTDAQDANFDGVPAQSFAGADDFATLDLRQVGGRRAVGSPSMSYSVIDPSTGLPPVRPAPAVGGGLSLDSGFADLGFADLGFADLGFADLGFADLGFGDLGFADLGFGDLGFGDLGAPMPDGSAPVGELDVETAQSVGASGPTGLSATIQQSGDCDRDDDHDHGGATSVLLQWNPPSVGSPKAYQVYRVKGAGLTPDNIGDKTLVAKTSGKTTSVTDTSKLSPGKTYTYFVTATLPPPAVCTPTAVYDCKSERQSPPSNLATVTVPKGKGGDDHRDR